MHDLLRAAGLAAHRAAERDIGGERVVVVWLDGETDEVLRRARSGLTDHYPVLLMDTMDLDRDYFRTGDQQHTPAEVLARAETVDLDDFVAQWAAMLDMWTLGVGTEGYNLDCYDIAMHGTPEFLAILPRPEPWAVFAYVNAYGGMGLQPELMVAAARRWHERYGAEPTVVSLACAFTVPRPPTDPDDALRLAFEHVRLAGLTADTTVRAYARALLQLDHWRLYDRP